jgi:hypothetical protein
VEKFKLKRSGPEYWSTTSEREYVPFPKVMRVKASAMGFGEVFRKIN